MDRQPLIEALTSIDDLRLSRLRFILPAAYKTIVEIIEFYERMDGYDEMDRLGDVKEWLEEATTELFGEALVNEWEAEAKSTEFSPFAQEAKEIDG